MNVVGVAKSEYRASMQGLYRRAAYRGGLDTTTATDQASGIVNELVGYALVYPAEFVVLRISQMAATCRRGR